MFLLRNEKIIFELSSVPPLILSFAVNFSICTRVRKKKKKKRNEQKKKRTKKNKKQKIGEKFGNSLGSSSLLKHFHLNILGHYVQGVIL